MMFHELDVKREGRLGEVELKRYAELCGFEGDAKLLPKRFAFLCLSFGLRFCFGPIGHRHEGHGETDGYHVEAMAEAASKGKQAMLSVAGLEKAKLEDLCAQAAKAESSGVCQIANELFPKGFSCAGTEPSILKLKELAEGAGALLAKVLKTSGGFHTSLMAPAQTKLGKALDDALPAMSPPTKTVYMNATGEPVKPGTDPKEIVELLKKQLTSRVLWEPCVRAMIREGVSEFYEVGPMKQIKAMMKRIDSKVWNTTTNVEV